MRSHRSMPLVARAAVASLAAVAAACSRGGPALDSGLPTSAPLLAVRPTASGPRGPQGAPTPAPTWTLPAGVKWTTPGTPTQAPGLGIPELTPAPPVAVGPVGPALVDPDIVALMARVDASRLQADVAALAGFGTRHVLSIQDAPDRGIGAARDWLVARFGAANAPGLAQVQVVLEPFELDFAGRRTPQSNVVATLPGLGRPKRLVYVSAHYDSRTVDVTDGGTAAPGADDDASGTAVLLELARVLPNRQWDAGIRLVAFAAEEPGLKGSAYHAPRLRQLGLPVIGVLNNDIVGSSRGTGGAVDDRHVRIFSAGPDDAPSRRLARYVTMIAQRYGPLEAIVEAAADRPQRGGDHQSFSDAGFAAVRLTSAQEDLGRQHSARDTQERLDPRYHAAIAQLNVAVVANLALAPPAVETAPQVRSSPAGLAVTWEPVSHAAVAGYWLAVRGPAEAVYRDYRWVGKTDRALIAPDGVAAVVVATADDRGHTSPFSPEGVASP